LIAEAMMAVLPGIDANDEAKTAAVFQFYTAGEAHACVACHCLWLCPCCPGHSPGVVVQGSTERCVRFETKQNETHLKRNETKRTWNVSGFGRNVAKR
jgi:hypothetical protein